ncbi:MAG: hypothetical protein KAQ85_01835 [Thermodesulfovibrionia bacterium]|nr:hypothetical protein [Thermodesulfovibrionia bacterium]MCK5306355.1 hypothetical protein [Candidatus Omnitrophota bacterium]
MTLILTELSGRGITMAADSAITLRNRQTGLFYISHERAKKLQEIPYLNAGISCWGMGQIDTKSTDKWLSDFIQSNSGIETLSEFAEKLVSKLNDLIPNNDNGEPRLGFHLSGFEKNNDQEPIPSFYHIHDGPSEVLRDREIDINSNQFNANHDMPPLIFKRDILSQRKAYITRNGDYTLYAQLFNGIETFLRSIANDGIIIPHSIDLEDRAEYLVFQIRTMAELYRLSNLVPGIGGAIDYLTIDSNGIHSSGTRYQ